MLVTIGLLRQVLTVQRPTLAAIWLLPDGPDNQWVDVRRIHRVDGTPLRPAGVHPATRDELALRVALRKANSAQYKVSGYSQVREGTLEQAERERRHEEHMAAAEA